MKIKVLLLFLLLSAHLPAQHHYPDQPSVHGMLLMGDQTVYASHLPMFHSPHDYQVIVSLRLKAEDHKVYQSDRAAHPGTYVYTLEPEVFVLPEKIEQGKTFRANIYRGHFERAGRKILQNIEVEIAEVIYFKQFKKDADRPENLRYILFGNAQEQFLAHLISKQPDFDEIIRVNVRKKGKKLLRDDQFILLEFPEKETGKPYSWTVSKAKLTGKAKRIKLTKTVTLYLEYGDLK